MEYNTSFNMNLVLNTLPNNTTLICKEEHSGYIDRLQKDLPSNNNYVVFDYQTVTETELVFFTMEAIERTKHLNLDNVILSYTQEALHRKFWEVSVAILSKAGYKKILLIDAGLDVAIQGYLNIASGTTVRHLTSSTWFDTYSSNSKKHEYIPFNNIRRKHYVSLARFSRKERIQLTCKLLDNTLLKNSGRYSCGWADYELDPYYWHEDKPLWDLIPEHLRSHFPITLGDEPEQQHDLLPHISDNVFNVVLEGVIGHNPASYTVNSDTSRITGRFHTVNSDRMMATEKTTKAFAMNQIPIFLATPGMVAKLRSMNFDLFDDIIDHSYDKEDDILNRIDLIIEQLIKVCEKPLEHWCDFLENNKNRFYHNQEHLNRLSQELHTTNKQVIGEFFV
tara:strand:+ start:221 stop:1399 length:1179 start_codon:yes stop_codon:yes gene_type:complete